ncbi:MAG TPA: hypothetical protein VHF27_12325, partial [Acidimicrobiales bacterium]|nr:hypothetical protein [Acidimicrobiales bacterium]
MRWDGEGDVSEGVRERAFQVDVEGRVVPGILWLPDSDEPGPRPLVLLGHGATRHKRVDYLLALGRRLAGDHRLAVASIDAPGHGGRRGPGPDDDIKLFGAFLAEWSREGSTDDMVADWLATIEAVRELDQVG